jgi:hypothetical protein
MTDILFQKLKERFPPVNDYERISIYGAYERIYLDLIDYAFIGMPYFDSQERIKNLALKTFDVNFISKFLKDGGEQRLSIIFEPVILNKTKMSYELFEYHENHSGHSMDVMLPSTHPIITISTGNRGHVDLLPKQRENYYNFVENVYRLFLENANK